MTAPVDVLAVLGHHATGLRTAPRLTVRQAERVSDELHAARAAVAELRDAARHALRLLEDEDLGDYRSAQDLRAALARVGGAP